MDGEATEKRSGKLPLKKKLLAKGKGIAMLTKPPLPLRKEIPIQNEPSQLMKATIIAFLGLLLAAVLFWVFKGKEDDTSAKKVGILLLVTHPVIHDLRDGFRERLDTIATERGFSVAYDEKNAEGDGPTLNQIVAHFSNGDNALIYAAGSEGALKLKSNESETPILFAGTPDPVKDGMVKSLEKPEGNVTGVMFFPPPKVLLDVLAHRYPAAKRIGVLRNPGEIGSDSVATKFISEARHRSFEIGDFGVTETAQINAALEKIKAGKWDAVFIPTDNLIYQNINRVASVLGDAGIPFFSVTDTSVIKGASFAIGISYRKLGESAGDLAAAILFDGKKVSEVPVYDPGKGFLMVPKGTEGAFAGLNIEGFPVTPISH